MDGSEIAMATWFCIPSIRPDGGSLPLWKARGYKLAVFRDNGAPRLPFEADIVIHDGYISYPKAVNLLIRLAAYMEPQAQWFVVAGDDIDPDPQHDPQVIADQCTAQFNGTFGVMQPTGDRWCIDDRGTCSSERVCDSPWIGREFALRSYKGPGPFCEEYFHFFVDEELHCVATKLGVLWHRRNIFQVHHHWSREHRERPAHLHPARLDWNKSKHFFIQRKAAGFPGYEPLVAMPAGWRWMNRGYSKD